MKHGAQLLQSPIMKKVLGTLNMGVRPDETPKAPVYMFHAKLDEGFRTARRTMRLSAGATTARHSV